jgi:hypothetical protein
MLEDVLVTGLGYARSKSYDTTSAVAVKGETERLLYALIKPYAREWAQLLKKPSTRNFSLALSRQKVRMLAAYVVGDLGKRALGQPVVPLASVIVGALPKGLWTRQDSLRVFLKNHGVGNEQIWHLQEHFDVWLADCLKLFPDHDHILREFVSSTSEVRRSGPTDWTARVFNDELTSFINSLPDDRMSRNPERVVAA